MDRQILATEQRNPYTTHIDTMSTPDMLRAMNAENLLAPLAVERAIDAIVPLVDHTAQAMRQGGRLFYVGAGTSGRLGVLDASECPPTFGVAPDRVIALLAGGPDAMFHANAAEEDNEAQGAADLNAYAPTPLDTVVGISAAGAAAYVIGAMRAAREAGAATASICCNTHVPMEKLADYPICVQTGAEAITGSTRLKAGSAQKMVLNLISTGVMIRLGKVYENYMVAVTPTNEKLRRRAVSMICSLTGCTEDCARAQLERSGDVRSAVESLRAQNGAQR